MYLLVYFRGYLFCRETSTHTQAFPSLVHVIWLLFFHILPFFKYDQEGPKSNKIPTVYYVHNFHFLHTFTSKVQGLKACFFSLSALWLVIAAVRMPGCNQFRSPHAVASASRPHENTVFLHQLFPSIFWLSKTGWYCKKDTACDLGKTTTDVLPVCTTRTGVHPRPLQLINIMRVDWGLE